MHNLSPMSWVKRLDSVKVKTPIGCFIDKQHSYKTNCGCHTCIRELAVIKYQPTVQKRKFFQQFQDSVGEHPICSTMYLQYENLACVKQL